MYKERHVIECMFGKLKYFRRIATRYEKKASHFMEMLAFVAVFFMAALIRQQSLEQPCENLSIFPKIKKRS